MEWRTTRSSEGNADLSVDGVKLKYSFVKYINYSNVLMNITRRVIG